jgi:translation initiation factor IF-3
MEHHMIKLTYALATEVVGACGAAIGHGQTFDASAYAFEHMVDLVDIDAQSVTDVVASAKALEPGQVLVISHVAG